MDLIFEIISEEIPSRMQKSFCDSFAKLAFDQILGAGILVQKDSISCLSSPSRITLIVKDLSEVQKIESSIKVGPKVGSDLKVIEGFAKSVGVDPNDLKTTIPAGKSAEYYYFEKPGTSTPTLDLLKTCLPKLIDSSISFWPKLMKWDDINSNWIRPVRNLMCIFGKDVVEFERFGLKTSNKTIGHHIYSPNHITIESVDDYINSLSKHCVIVDQNKRKDLIKSQIKEIENKLSLKVSDKDLDALIFELTGLCDFPTCLVGSISDEFMSLPEEILLLTLKTHQRYLCLRNADGSISNKFIFASNAVTDNNSEIISGNEKVAKARLSDAQFFVDEDLKTPLRTRLLELKSMVFHNKLGSVYDKCARTATLAKFVSMWVPMCDIALINHAAFLSKADLVTKAVSELPDLQGKIGMFYAKKNGETKSISDAIYEHYLPFGTTEEGSKLPQSPLGITLSIADKMDSITGMFLIDEKPTGSRDPFALRRAALGIIKIIVSHKIAIPMRVMIEKSIICYGAKFSKKHLNKTNKNEIVFEIMKFFVERLRSYLKDDQSISYEVASSLIDQYLSNIASHKYLDIFYLFEKIKFVNSCICDPSYKKILESYTRASNIVAIEEKKSGSKYGGRTGASLNKYESSLNKALKKIQPEYKKLVKHGRFLDAFEMLKTLENPISDFFLYLEVNDKKEKVRERRLNILANVAATFHLICDFSNLATNQK